MIWSNCSAAYENIYLLILQEEVFNKNEDQDSEFLKGKLEETKTTADIFKKENIIFEEKCSQLKLEIKR